jgi:hypothetical protein
MGHFFGLRHIWGDGDEDDCTNSDDIDDTPNAAGPYFGCPSGEQISCGTSDMYQNFMDFTDDRCLAAFTHGQVARMQAVAEIYYPQLYSESGCTVAEHVFEKWIDELTWAVDHASRKIILYHPSGFDRQIQLRVFSVDGRMVYKTEIGDAWSALIDLNTSRPGIFLVQMMAGDECRVRKVVMW